MNSSRTVMASASGSTAITRAPTPIPSLPESILNTLAPLSRCALKATSPSAKAPAITRPPTTHRTIFRTLTRATLTGYNITMTLSYADGASETPLLGETIGDNLARTAATQPDADALVSCQQDLRWSYAE